MKVKQKKLDGGRVRLSVSATAEDVDKAFTVAAQAFAQSLGIQPNPNMSAEQAIAEKLKIRDVDSVITSQVADALVPFALEKANIIPQFMPEHESTERLRRSHPYSFHVTVTPKPIYALKSYEPAEVTVPKFVFDDSMVDDEMQRFVQSYPEYVKAEDHPVQKGDSCLIAIDVRDDAGERLEALCTAARTFTTGQGYMPDSFEEQVYGMNPGETKSFEFDAPDFDEDLGQVTKTFSATVTIKEIQQEAIPTLTDEWVKRSMPMYGSVDEMRKAFSVQLERQQREQYNAQVAAAVDQQFADRFEGSIPNEAYEATSKSLDQQLRSQLKQQGIEFDEFVEQQGGEQNYNMGIMMQTRDILRRDYALDAVFDHEGLSITDEDIRAACREINPQNPAIVEKTMQAEGKMFALREIAMRIAASNYCVAHAKITVQGQDDAPSADEQ